MALGSTLPLTEMSTRDIFWGWRRSVLRADNITTFTYRFSRNSWRGLSSLVMRQLYLLIFFRHGGCQLCCVCGRSPLEYRSGDQLSGWNIHIPPSNFRDSWFQTFAVFCMLNVFFWVIPRRLNFICRRSGTLWLFHLHRQVGTYPPMKMERQCFETSAFKFQTPGNYPEESMQFQGFCW